MRIWNGILKIEYGNMKWFIGDKTVGMMKCENQNVCRISWDRKKIDYVKYP